MCSDGCPVSTIIDSPGKAQTAEERFEKVRTLVFNNSNQPSAQLAAEVAELIREAQKSGRNAVLGLATGSTPVPFYRELIRLHEEEGLSFKNVITFNLDEYYGLERDHPESYFRFMNDQLFGKIDIPPENVNVPDGTVPSDEVYDWCQAYERKIDEAGGLDLQILGIGRTGHIGFNEPGSSRDSSTRMITLDRITRRDAASDFLGEENVPRAAITMGVGTIMKAKSVVLMAWGENKAEILQEAVEGDVTESVSASFLQEHENATFVVDSAGASQLTRYRCPWLVRSVRWREETTRKAVVWLSRALKKPVLKLVDEDYNEHGMSQLITGPRNAYDVNIQVFNQLQHTITGWPGGKPNADDNQRPERREPELKNVLVLSPEPQDAVVSMGGTLERLIEQRHNVSVVCQTSGNLRVADNEARTFAGVLSEVAEGEKVWNEQAKYAEGILKLLEEKGQFGTDAEKVRKLKGLILRGETRDGVEACKLANEQLDFLDLPFYEEGRYRRFNLGDADVEAMIAVLKKVEPHQIFATGQVADPSSLQALCFTALAEALKVVRPKNCRVWIYRGKEKPLESHEINMAVPMSPGQLEAKEAAIRKFRSIHQDEMEATTRNHAIATEYDRLGMAEYEAIEAFQRWDYENES